MNGGTTYTNFFTLENGHMIPSILSLFLLNIVYISLFITFLLNTCKRDVEFQSEIHLWGDYTTHLPTSKYFHLSILPIVARFNNHFIRKLIFLQFENGYKALFANRSRLIINKFFFSLPL